MAKTRGGSTEQKAAALVRALRMHPTVMVKAHLLNPAPYNPNKMAPEKYEALKQSMREDGVCEDLVVQKNGLNIIGGHHRLRAIKEICVEDGEPIPEIPCKILDVDDVAAKKLNLKLNHIHGEPDARMLGEVLADIFPATAVIEPPAAMALGISLDDVNKYIQVVEPDRFPSSPDSKEVGGFGRSVTLSLEFNDVRDRDRVKEILQHRTDVEKKKTGDIIAELLTGKSSKKRPTRAA